MSASTAVFPGLGFDPTPGDESLAQVATATLRDAAQALEQISNVLHGSGSTREQWRGQAAEAFRGLMDDELRPKIDQAAESFNGSLRALEGWMSFMGGAQETSRRFEREAVDLKDKLDAKNAALGSLPPAPPPGAAPPGPAGAPAGEPPSPDTDAERTNLTGQIDGLAQLLADVQAQARRHAEDYVRQGELVAGQLAKALDAAPNEPGFWDSLGDGIAGMIGELGDAVEWLGEQVMDGLQWVWDNLAPILQTIGDIAAMLSPILGMLALIPGLQILGAVSLALAGIAFLTHYGAAAKKHGSFLEPWKDPKTLAQLGTDLAGVVVGGGAALAGARLARVASAGNVRPVTQFIGGGTKPVPYNMFTVAKNGASMNSAEFGTRMVKYHLDATGHTLTGVGVPNTAGTVRDWTRGEWGKVPMKVKRTG